MKLILFLFLLILSTEIENKTNLFLSSRTPAENTTQVPQYLFHWRFKNTSSALFKKIKSKYGIVQQWPDLNLQDKEALFTWSHPIGGMKYPENNEFYAGPTKTQDFELIVLKTDPNSKVLNLASIYKRNEPLTSASISLDHYDFIFHQVYNQDGSLRYREWLVLNPQKILSAISDPRNYPDSVLSELNIALKPNYELMPDQKLSSANSVGEYEHTKIQQLLKPRMNRCKNLFD